MQLELCQTIETYVKDLKNVTEGFYWSVLLDILLAVKALHDRDLIHLDIKLDNILIDEDNVCKLSDFGLVMSEKKVRRIFCMSENAILVMLCAALKMTSYADIFAHKNHILLERFALKLDTLT